MRSAQNRRRIGHGWLLLGLSIVTLCGPKLTGQEKEHLPEAVKAPLTAEQVVRKLEEKNLERAAALREFQGSRVYRMRYRGFPGNRDAEMVVTIDYHAPDAKKFSIISQSGSKFIINRVFKKLLEGEQEAASEENRRRTALDTTNYHFSLTGYETTPQGSRYILEVVPKTNNKFLYRGRVWIDAHDFAVTRIEVEPAKNPSFWIKKSQIRHEYVKLGDFWLPAENHTESWIRLGGQADLSIEYKDYRVGASPLQAAQDLQNNVKVISTF